MRFAVWRKELRELRPYLLLALFLSVLNFLDFSFEWIDSLPLGSTFARLYEWSVPVFVVAFAIGTGISNRERNDRTLSFIDGLPLGRLELFFAKLLAALLVLMLLPVLQALMLMVLHLWARGTLDQALHPDLVIQLLALQAVTVFVGLALGTALGLLRSLAWSAVGMLAAALAVLRHEIPWMEALNPIALALPKLRGARWEVPWDALWIQLAVAVALLLLGAIGFVRAGLPRGADRARHPVVNGLLVLVTAGSLFGAVALWMPHEEDQDHSGAVAEEGPYFPPSAPAQMHTAHYRFSYPAHAANQALPLTTAADRVFGRVHELLGAAPGEPIEADLSGSQHNTVGTAFFGRLRMELTDDAVAVLAHETSHVVAARLAGGERATLWDQAVVLNEGIASWVERDFATEAGRKEVEAHRFVLAALHQRHRLHLDELYDFDSFAASWDEGLKYPIGAALIDATVEVYGTEAVGRLVHAFAEPRLPQDLSGFALWSAVFQLAGMDLGRVTDAFFAQVIEDARLHEASLNELPRPIPFLVRTDEEIAVDVQLDRALPDGWSVMLRFRPGPDSGADTYSTRRVRPGKPVPRDWRSTRRGEVCVQAGLRRGWITLYEEWTCLPMSSVAQIP